MVWVEALAKIILVFVMLSLLVTAAIVITVVIKAIAEILVVRWRRKRGEK